MIVRIIALLILAASVRACAWVIQTIIEVRRGGYDGKVPDLTVVNAFIVTGLVMGPPFVALKCLQIIFTPMG